MNSLFSSVEDYVDVQPQILLEVAHFFSICKYLEGKRTEVLGWKDRKTAYEITQAANKQAAHLSLDTCVGNIPNNWNLQRVQLSAN